MLWSTCVWDSSRMRHATVWISMRTGNGANSALAYPPSKKPRNTRTWSRASSIAYTHATERESLPTSRTTRKNTSLRRARLERFREDNGMIAWGVSRPESQHPRDNRPSMRLRSCRPQMWIPRPMELLFPQLDKMRHHKQRSQHVYIAPKSTQSSTTIPSRLVQISRLPLLCFHHHHHHHHRHSNMPHPQYHTDFLPLLCHLSPRWHQSLLCHHTCSSLSHRHNYSRLFNPHQAIVCLRSYSKMAFLHNLLDPMVSQVLVTVLHHLLRVQSCHFLLAWVCHLNRILPLSRTVVVLHSTHLLTSVCLLYHCSLLQEHHTCTLLRHTINPTRLTLSNQHILSNSSTNSLNKDIRLVLHTKEDTNYHHSRSLLRIPAGCISNIWLSNSHDNLQLLLVNRSLLPTLPIRHTHILLLKTHAVLRMSTLWTSWAVWDKRLAQFFLVQGLLFLPLVARPGNVRGHLCCHDRSSVRSRVPPLNVSLHLHHHAMSLRLEQRRFLSRPNPKRIIIHSLNKRCQN